MQAPKRFLSVVLFLLLAPYSSLADEQPLTGMWDGTYDYQLPSETERHSVAFTMILIQKDGGITGSIREHRSDFGEGDDPWLHSTFKGKFNPVTREFLFLKTYDGTAKVEHDVEYRGTVTADGKSVLGGKWELGSEDSGTFSLEKKKGTGAGLYSGKWKGKYHYLSEPQKDPVEFSMIIVNKDDGLTGFIREPNTISEGGAPWLHASFRGSVNQETREVVFLKTYDGTSYVDHDVEYRGKFSSDGTAVLGGQWEIGSDTMGRFNLRKVEDQLEGPSKKSRTTDASKAIE